MTMPMPTDAPKIFISYAWENQATARQLQQALYAAGAEVFVDYTGIQGGESLPTRISQALDWCDTLILLWSPTAANSHWVELEWTSAVALNRRLIPCKLDETSLPKILWGKRYLEFENFDHGLNELLAALRLKRPATIIPEPKIVLPVQSPILKLRSQPIDQLSGEVVKAMLKKYDFYCAAYGWSKAWCNPQGQGIAHKYELQHDGKVVADHATDLMWQQSGSPHYMNYADTEKYTRDLNNQRFSGYSDWRLPTLEETMSLMEREKKNGDLYIDSLFDKTQLWIWTADMYSVAGRAWYVLFHHGNCNHYVIGYNFYVRAVR